MLRTVLLILLLSVGSTRIIYAQEDTTQHTRPPVRVETKDGSLYYGHLVKQDRDRIILQTESVGTLEIPLSKVRKISFNDDRSPRTTGRRLGSREFDNPNPFRYLFFPSAFTLPRGELQYQNTYFLLNSVAWGVTDNISLSGGLEFISTFAGRPIFFIAPKVGFSVRENLRLGGGAIYLNGTGPFDFGGFTALYGAGTFGNVDRNMTLGLGYGVVNRENIGGGLLTISGMIRLGRHLGLVTENWLVPVESGGALLSLGLRIMGRRVAGDIALLGSPGAGDVGSVLPYFSLSVRL